MGPAQALEGDMRRAEAVPRAEQTSLDHEPLGEWSEAAREKPSSVFSHLDDCGGAIAIERRPRAAHATAVEGDRSDWAVFPHLDDCGGPVLGAAVSRRRPRAVKPRTHISNLAWAGIVIITLVSWWLPVVQGEIVPAINTTREGCVAPWYVEAPRNCAQRRNMKTWDRK